MKADRRHELQENELSHWIEVARTRLSANARPIGFGVLAVVAVFVITGLAVRSRTAAQEESWRRFAQLMYDKPETARESLDALLALSKDSSDPQFALAALIELGRQSLNLSQKWDVVPDKDLIDRAQTGFTELLKRFPENPMALGVGRCGLATVEENLFVLDRSSLHKDEAGKHLKAVVEDSRLSGMPFQRIALDRLAVLDQTFSFVPLVPGGAGAAPVGNPLSNIQGLPPGVKVVTPPGQPGSGVPLNTLPVAPPAKTPAELGVDTADSVEEEPEPVDRPEGEPKTNPTP